MTRDGDVLIASGVTVDADRTAFLLDAITFCDLGDGTVTITEPDD